MTALLIKDSLAATSASSTIEEPRPGPNVQQPITDASPITRPAAALNLPADHLRGGTQRCDVGGDLNVVEQRDQSLTDAQEHPVSLFDPLLGILAEALTDIESVRMAQANRYRILTSTGVDKDGGERGHGLTDDAPPVAALHAHLDALAEQEKALTKALGKQLRTHPLYPWVKAQNGLGDKTIARLLAVIGDPYWRDEQITADGEVIADAGPRTVGQLFALCGVAGPGQRRRKGEKGRWNPEARKRLWIITGPIIRNAASPYRLVYDEARVQYADKLHTEPCAQCGKKGEPAPEGSPWRDGHKHAGAIRLVMRAILRDLWTQARALHSPPT